MSVFVPQESDRPSGLALTALGIVWAGLTVVAVLIAVWILQGRRDALGYTPPAGPPEVAPVEVRGVNQTQIRTARSPTRVYEPDQERLHRWGWVDAEEGVVHIPIEVAIRLMLGEEEP